MSSELADPDFDLSTISRIVVLPLAYGAYAPNRRKASWNGGAPYSLPFNTEEALAWQSLHLYRAGRPVAAPPREYTPTFLRFGRHVTGRHESARVAILSDEGFETAVDIANSLLSVDGRRGSKGVGEWAPALITTGESTTLGIHLVCLDDETDAQVIRLLRERAGLRARVAFSRCGHVEQTDHLEGSTLEESWNPLRLMDKPSIWVRGVARRSAIPTEFLSTSPFGSRIRAAVPNPGRDVAP